jgi:hypothetical protein
VLNGKGQALDALSCLWLRPSEQRARHPGHTGLARPSVDHQHGAEQVQGLLAGLTSGQPAAVLALLRIALRRAVARARVGPEPRL